VPLRLVNLIGIDDKSLRGYKWLVKRTIRKHLNRRHGPVTKDSRKLVIFRLDDVGFGSINALMAIMDVFIKKNHSLSLGLVMNPVDRERSLIEKIEYGKNRGLFELALHGWNHVDYSKLGEKEQQDTLYDASKKMQNLFGQPSKVFIPPFNSFNASTRRAMNKVGVRIISSMLNYEDEKDIFRMETIDKPIMDPDRTYHVPETACFEKWDRNRYPIRIPIKQILDDIDVSFWHYGYAVITMHPITFIKLQGRESDGVVDEHQINDLTTLLECVESKNAIFTSFSKITAIN
jgi:peptidoglycan/xylan/chitin deacetylase (PgdA/CDA1 family)